jgi:hypothetical protein
MDGRVDEHQLRIAILQALHGPGSTMGGTVVDDPEDAAGVVVRGTRHYLLDQAIKRALPFLASQRPKTLA